MSNSFDCYNVLKSYQLYMRQHASKSGKGYMLEMICKDSKSISFVVNSDLWIIENITFEALVLKALWVLYTRRKKIL